MDISKEVDKLRTKYNNIQNELQVEYDSMYHSKEQVTKDEKDSLDNKIKKSKYLTNFIKELLGSRLLYKVNGEFNGKVTTEFSEDADYSTDNYLELLLYYPRFNDKTIEEYINRILENGIDKAAQEWFNSDNHNKVHEFYNMNSGMNSNCHNTILKAVWESWKLEGKDSYLKNILTIAPMPVLIEQFEETILKNGYTDDWIKKNLDNDHNAF